MDSIGHSESSSISSSAKAPSLFGIRKSISSSLFSHLPNNSTVKNNVVSGTLLIGELSFTLPSKKNFPKVTGTHSFTLNGKKEIAKCTMQMGLIFDEDGYTSIPKVVRRSVYSSLCLHNCITVGRGSFYGLLEFLYEHQVHPSKFLFNFARINSFSRFGRNTGVLSKTVL